MADQEERPERSRRRPNRLLQGLLLGGAAVGIPALANALVARRTRPLSNPAWGRAHRYAWKGGEISFQQLGDGDPVLLLHSLGPGHDAEQWRAAGELLARKRLVFAVDLLGWGRSEKPRVDYDSGLYIDLIADFLEAVVDGPCHVVAVGASAAYAVQVAIEHPDRIRSLGLVVPQGVGFEAGAAGGRRDLYHRLLRLPVVGTSLLNLYTSQPALQQQLRREASAAGEPVDTERIDHLYRSSHQPGARGALAALLSGRLAHRIDRLLAELQQPVWLCWGRHAADTPVETADLWLQRLPNAQLEVLEETGALPHSEAPDRFTKQLETFLAAV